MGKTTRETSKTNSTLGGDSAKEAFKAGKGHRISKKESTFGKGGQKNIALQGKTYKERHKGGGSLEKKPLP